MLEIFDLDESDSEIDLESIKTSDGGIVDGSMSSDPLQSDNSTLLDLFKEYNFEHKQTQPNCNGCGIQLQSNKSHAVGYISESSIND